MNKQCDSCTCESIKGLSTSCAKEIMELDKQRLERINGNSKFMTTATSFEKFEPANKIAYVCETGKFTINKPVLCQLHISNLGNKKWVAVPMIEDSYEVAK